MRFFYRIKLQFRTLRLKLFFRYEKQPFMEAILLCNRVILLSNPRDKGVSGYCFLRSKLKLKTLKTLLNIFPFTKQPFMEALLL